MLFHREFGIGQDIVILHGILGSSDMWIPTAQALKKEFHIIIPDLPNHGKSIHINTISYESQAEIIWDFLDSISVRKPIIIGHSYGGKIALKMLTERPHHISKLILIDITSEMCTPTNCIMELYNCISTPLPSFFRLVDIATYFQNHFTQNPNIVNLLLKGLKRSKEGFVWKWNTPIIVSQYQSIFAPILLPKTISTQTLLIKGENSCYVTSNNIQNLKCTFTDFTLVEIKHAGHWVQNDNFSDFIGIVSSFIKKEKT